MDTTRGLSWGMEKRLEFIEFRLFWDGYIRRADLQEKFDISAPQASNDLAFYRESLPQNINYDLSAKRYVRGNSFKPEYYSGSPDRYLAQLRAVEEGILAEEDTFFGFRPDIDVLPIPSRSVTAARLRHLVQAIREKKSLRIEYQSMNDKRPEPQWRTISPHALASDGMRWHVRAFCHIEEKFKDFIISRCLKVGDQGAWHPKAVRDDAWESYFEVSLIPNPELSPSQQKTIERDYDMRNGECVLSVRLALIYYFDKRLRLDLNGGVDRPKEKPIIVKNREEYEMILRSLRT